MDLRLKSILIRNWKKIEELKIDFQGKNVNIYGYNETGKTTVYDAFLWLLFGKDSLGQSDFDIKPIIDGEVQHNLQSLVSAEIFVDGTEFELTKMLTEKWIKKHGSEAPAFDGHETSCWFNSEPLKIGDYQKKIASIMTDEKIFRKITNADAFLSMKKQDMRAALVDMAGDIDPLVVAGDDQTLINLVSLMEQKRLTVEALVKISKQNIRQYNDEIDGIPARVDEVKRAMPAYVDYDKARADLNELTREGNELTISLSSISKSDRQGRIDELQARRRELVAKILKSAGEVVSSESKAIDELSQKISLHSAGLAELDRRLKEIPTKENLESKINEHRELWKTTKEAITTVKESTFTPPEVESVCYACGQALPEEKIQSVLKQAEEEFSERRQRMLRELIDTANSHVEEAKNLKAQIEESEALRAKTTEDIERERKIVHEAMSTKEHHEQIKNASLAMYEDPARGDPSIFSIDHNIKELEAKSDDNRAAEIMARIEEVKKEVSRLTLLLGTAEQISAGNIRMAELQEKNRELANMVAKQEKLRDACERYMQRQSKALAENINKQFSYVSFRLFEEQINGGIVDDCTPMINGINYYTNGSRSQKIRAGLDIIRTMQKAYDVKAPVFVDNAESANWLLPMNCQVVRLIVSEADKKLRVEVEEDE